MYLGPRGNVRRQNNAWKHCWYNLFCCNSGECEEQWFFGGGDNSNDGASLDEQS